MECGKLTAKLRDAVPVCLMVNGREIMRYRNIEIPDSIKKLPFTDFKFDVPVVGAITFKITFSAGVLPDPMPETRARKSRKPAMGAPADLPQGIAVALADTVPETQEESHPLDDIIETERNGDPIEEKVAEMPECGQENIRVAEEPEIMEIAYHATGERRKDLVKEISQFTGMTAAYQNAPTFAYVIEDYIVDKSGTLTGGNNAALVEFLAEQGFIAD